MGDIGLGLTWSARGLPAPLLVILDMTPPAGNTQVTYWAGGPKKIYMPHGWVGVGTCSLRQGSPLFATQLLPQGSVLDTQYTLFPFLTLATHPHKQHC